VKPAVPSKSSSGWPRLSWRLLVLPFSLFILLPLLALFLRITPSDLWSSLNSNQVTEALSLSLVTSLSTVAVTIVFGTPVAYYLSHRHYRFHRLLDTLIDLPTVLPPAVAGVALLVAFGRRGLLGGALESIGVSLPFTSLAVVMAQTFIAAPFYIKSAALGFSGVNCELRRAAALDGATRWQTFRYIMVPMSWIALLSGAVMTWARALGEFGATIIFAGNFPGRTQTMPLAIYIGFEIDLNVAITLAIILVCLAFFILIVVKAYLHSQIEPGPAETDY
jgi:molybdate transport system permease protein